jgi:drug/metabolite transporter (DMT)-like permease
MPAPTLTSLEERRLHAIALMVLAVTGFTGIDTCAKWLVLDGLPTAQVVFVRYLGHLLIVVALALPAGDAVFRSRNLGAVAVRGLALLASTVLNFAALGFLPLTMTAAIMFSMPLWVCLLSIPFLGERVGPRRWAAILVGFGGILVVTRPWSGTMHWAAMLSLGAALCGALYAILTRRLAGRDSTATQQFYAALVATVGTAPLALADWAWPTGAASWLAFVAIGGFGWAGHQLMIVAHRYAPASTLAPFTYTQIVAMTASSWLIFAQPPDAWVLVGGGIVVASGLYIWLRERTLSAVPARRGL